MFLRVSISGSQYLPGPLVDRIQAVGIMSAGGSHALDGRAVSV